MKRDMPLEKAHDLALQFCLIVAPYCERIVVAGSIRREKAIIGDIEVVAIPKRHVAKQYTLFGDSVDLTTFPIEEWWKSDSRVKELNDGHKYKKLLFNGVQVDLFLQPNPETWGMNLMIRTGSAWFAKMMVTKKESGGFMPDNFTGGSVSFVTEGDVKTKLDTREEKSVFDLWGKPFIPPKFRDENFFINRDGVWKYKGDL